MDSRNFPATAQNLQSSFSFQQAQFMDKHLTKSFQIPSSPMRVFATMSRFTTIALYYRILVLVARKFSWLQHGINFLKRTGIGFVMSVLFILVFIREKYKL